MVSLIRQFGGSITQSEEKDTYISRSSTLHSTDIDAEDIPDLVPILAVLASVSEGTTRIYGASRLKLKESDRLMSVCSVLSALGADIAQTEDGLLISGRSSLTGGRVSSYGDHRIAMSAAVAACVCSAPVIIDGAEAVQKSYPSFWDDMRSLGIICDTLA